MTSSALIFQAGAFDDAVKGMDAIVHTASPADFSVENPDGNLISF